MAAGSALSVASSNLSAATLVQSAGLAGVGLGASLLATAVATRLISQHVYGIDVAEAIEALRGTSPFSRSNQTVEITLSRAAERIRVEAVHRFTLHVQGVRSRTLPFTIYTDLGSWGKDGGFLSVKGPDGYEVKGPEIKENTVERSGKAQYARSYDLSPSKPAEFAIVTFGLFRCIDRLTWTVEHVSSDFKVTVRNLVDGHDCLYMKINHHREAEIVGQPTPTTTGYILSYDFLGEVLPYQGFELFWNFDLAT